MTKPILHVNQEESMCMITKCDITLPLTRDGVMVSYYSKLHAPSCLGQETAKGPFGIRVKQPPAHLFATRGGG